LGEYAQFCDGSFFPTNSSGASAIRHKLLAIRYKLEMR
jgi:hypothetical protein